MFRKILSFFDQNAYRREVAQYAPIVARINRLEAQVRPLSDSELSASTGRLRERLQRGVGLEDLLPEAFAVVREAARRTIGLRHYDVQMIGGIVLQRGAIAEMRTGEGKTLVATLPLYLNALEGQGAHLVTVNDYLARRDARWMGPIFQRLGMRVGVLQADEPGSPVRTGYLVDPDQPPSEERFNLLRPVPRAVAYAADVTYGTNSEFGFDYLRDNLVRRQEEKAQRGHHFAIVDEVDNILIDEARTPLIISGENRSEIEWYSRMAQVVSRLNPYDVEVNRRDRIVSLTPEGERHVNGLLVRRVVDSRRPEEATPEQRHLIGHLEQALRARFLYERDREYIVQNGQVVIVDEITGRMMPGRRWTDGLHQAVEAREGLEVQSESMTYATVTLQNYFRMYAKLSGMTGTALTATREFEKTYQLKVHPIPTHVEYQALGQGASLLERQEQEPGGQPFTVYVRREDPQARPLFWKRVDYPDQLYLTAEAKRRAITWEVLRYHVQGRPLLVGTTSVGDSEDLARYLEGPLLVRLVQARLLRFAWLKTHPEIHPELPAKELEFLNSPLGFVSPARLEQAFSGLGLAADPLANPSQLLDLLEVEPVHEPRLVAALQAGIPNMVLNARYHYEESQIIAGAGAYSSVIIATNMAGRGVDIKLGGELAEEVLAAVNQVLEQAGIAQPYSMTLAERRQALQKLAPGQTASHQAEVDFFLAYVDGMERVKHLGGLHVVGGTRHEARRIDNQLRGRAARQGDPGSSRFFVSMEDDLMVRFGGLEAAAFLEQEKLRAGDPLLPVPVEPGRRVIETAQNRVESENFDIRQHLLDYDDVINAQRLAIYGQRDRILSKFDLSADLAEMLATELDLEAQRSLQAGEDPQEQPAQPWKFVAWVERLQPSRVRPEGRLFPSWALRVLRQRALADWPAPLSPEQARLILPSLAERAWLAEEHFVQEEAERLCRAAVAELHAGAAQRMEAVDAALDSLDLEQAARRPRQVLRALADAAGLPVQLSEAALQSLQANPRQASLEVLDQIEAQLLQGAAQRLAAGLESLLGQAPEWVAAAPTSPEALVERARAAVQAAFEDRRERIFGAQGELAALLARLDEPLDDEQLWVVLEAMRGSGVGSTGADRQAADVEGQVVETEGEAPDGGQPAGMVGTPVETLPDETQPGGEAEPSALGLEPGEAERTRQPAPPRLNYVYLVDELLANMASDEIAQQALEHLLQAQQALKDDLGADWLSEAYRQLLLNSIDEHWVDYLTHLEELRYEVRLEGLAHNDPLVMYKSRASGAYGKLLAELRRAVVAQMFRFLPAARLVGTAEASSLEKATPRLTFLKLG